MNNEFAEKGLPPEKPTLLPVLLVLSYINTIIGVLMYALMLVFAIMVRNIPYDEFRARVDEATEQFQGHEGFEAIEQTMEIFYISGILWAAILLIRTVVRLAGVFLMHRRRLMGFQVYAVAQLIGLFAPLLVLPWSMFGYFGAFMVVLMVALYGSQRKWLTDGPAVPPAI